MLSCPTILEICIHKRNSFPKFSFVKKPYINLKSKELFILTANCELMRMGYIMSKDLYLYLCNYEVNQETIIDFVNVIKEKIGDDVKYEPMYPNFPEQVMEMDKFELYYIAILHYWSHGSWKPEYIKNERPFYDEKVKYKEIGIIENYFVILENIVESKDSISDYDKKIIESFLIEFDNSIFENLNIINREIKTYIASLYYKNNLFFRDDFVDSATDVLRIMTELSDGDSSLSENCKFKSFPRKTRKFFLHFLEIFITEEDIKRHQNKWVKLFHSLHVGDYKKAYPKCFEIATKIRSNKTLESFNSRVEKLINDREYLLAASLLSQRPGEFARRLDKLLRESKDVLRVEIIEKFFRCAHKIPTKNLLQLYGFFKSRNEIDFRIAFPKAKVQKVLVYPNTTKKISAKYINFICEQFRKHLIIRFSELDSLGNVYLDERLKKCPMPTQQRSSSKSSDVYARGTRFSFGNKNWLRFFIYWIGSDIDLSATFYNRKFEIVYQISYTNLKFESLGYHSGDITDAPNGAAEFIDIDVDSCVEEFDCRYLAMNVMVYEGPTFKEHEKCYAGFMTRDKSFNNEIYDPKTVGMKFDLEQKTKNIIPLVFDLYNKEVIYTDLSTSTKFWLGGNNVHSNRHGIEKVLQSIIKRKTVTLYDLFEMHIEARGKFSNLENADIVFTMLNEICKDKGEIIITPKDINKINSEFI